MLIFTLGDPHSVNIEILSKALGHWKMPESLPVFVVGSLPVWQHQTTQLGYQNNSYSIHLTNSFADYKYNCINFIDLSSKGSSQKELTTQPLYYLENLQSYNSKLAVITLPIDKSIAGFAHTEFFEDLWQDKAIMTLVSQNLIVGLATNHIPVSSVPTHLNSDLIDLKIQKLGQALIEIVKKPSPRIAVCGLNPHAGDNGMFGSEEQEIIIPAIQSARSKLPNLIISGPHSADTVFYKCLQGEFDAVLAMYHDQGLTPIKTVAFESAINATLGLKHLRVSPDHGPASDLFLKNIASSKSLEKCIDFCLKYLNYDKCEF